MQISIKGKQVDVGDALRQYIEEAVSAAVGKYFPKTIESSVVVSREAHLFRVDISVHAKRGLMLQSEGTAADPHAATDDAVARMNKRLSRYKNRIRDHHLSHEDEGIPANNYILSADATEEEPDNPVVVAEMSHTIETLTVNEAVMRLDLGQLPALLFRNRAHGGLNMVYRRADGHLGWVDPANALAVAATPAAKRA